MVRVRVLECKTSRFGFSGLYNLPWDRGWGVGKGALVKDHLFYIKEIISTLAFFFFKILFIFFDRERHSRGGNTSRGSERGRSRLPTEQGAWCRARTQDPGITTGAEGRCLMTEPPRRPTLALLYGDVYDPKIICGSLRNILFNFLTCLLKCVLFVSTLKHPHS